MFKRWMLVSTMVLATRLAQGDQAEVIDPATAAKADKLIEYGAELRHYCAPCGDKVFRRELVGDKEIETGAPGEATLYINGAVVDLAYVYVESEGKWSNVGKLAGAKVDGVPETLPADLPEGLADFDRVKYVGLIDGHIAISAELSKYNTDMNGTYFYADVGTTLNLTGEIDQLGVVKLEETDSDAQKTGSFEGKLSEGGAKVEGTWSNADGSKKLGFSLKRIALYGEENGSILAGSQSTETHLDFPVFIAGFGPAYTAVNEAIQAATRAHFTEYAVQFAATAAELGLDAAHAGGGDGEPNGTISVGDDMVFLANDRVVSVLFNVSLYQGGAHGMTMSQPVNLRISKNGEAWKTTPITMAELLKPGPEVLTALGNFLLEALKKRDASSVTSGDIKTFKPEDLSAFTLSPKGVMIYFDPYAVASYAEGPMQVFVPFSALPDVFAPEALKGITDAAKPSDAPTTPPATAAPATAPPAAKPAAPPTKSK